MYPSHEDFLRSYLDSLPPGHPLKRYPPSFHDPVIQAYPRIASPRRSTNPEDYFSHLSGDAGSIAKDIVSLARVAQGAHQEWKTIRQQKQKKLREDAELPKTKMETDQDIDDTVPYKGGYGSNPHYGQGYPHGFSAFRPWKKLKIRPKEQKIIGGKGYALTLTPNGFVYSSDLENARKNMGKYQDGSSKKKKSGK